MGLSGYTLATKSSPLYVSRHKGVTVCPGFNTKQGSNGISDTSRSGSSSSRLRMMGCRLIGGDEYPIGVQPPVTRSAIHRGRLQYRPRYVPTKYQSTNPPSKGMSHKQRQQEQPDADSVSSNNNSHWKSTTNPLVYPFDESSQKAADRLQDNTNSHIAKSGPWDMLASITLFPQHFRDISFTTTITQFTGMWRYIRIRHPYIYVPIAALVDRN